MKKILTFLLGFIVGVGVTFLVAFFLTKNNSSIVNNSRGSITLFEKEGNVVSDMDFRVFQVLDSGDALAAEFIPFVGNTGLVVLFLKEEGKSYYDNQIIEISDKKKVVKQVGIYKYRTKDETEKTVPIVAIRNK